MHGIVQVAGLGIRTTKNRRLVVNIQILVTIILCRFGVYSARDSVLVVRPSHHP